MFQQGLSIQPIRYGRAVRQTPGQTSCLYVSPELKAIGSAETRRTRNLSDFDCLLRTTA